MIRRASASAFEAAENRTPAEDAVHERRALEGNLREGFDIIQIELDAARREARADRPARVHAYLDAIILHCHTQRKLLPPAEADPVREAGMRAVTEMLAGLGLPR